MKMLLIVFFTLTSLSTHAEIDNYCSSLSCGSLRAVKRADLAKEPNLRCKKLEEPLLYFKVDGFDAQGALIENLPGYASRFYNSDFRCATIKNIWGGDWTFEGTDFRYADLSGINIDNAGLELKGAFFNNQTKLPFSRQEAEKRGMIFKP